LVTCQEWSVLDDWAPSLGAAVVQLEHRFFGVSNPSTDSNVTKRYTTLTLDNVLKDSVAFVDHVKKTNPNLSKAQVIAHGGMSRSLTMFKSLTSVQAPMAASWLRCCESTTRRFSMALSPGLAQQKAMGRIPRIQRGQIGGLGCVPPALSYGWTDRVRRSPTCTKPSLWKHRQRSSKHSRYFMAT
jgi:hypothetical protein